MTISIGTIDEECYCFRTNRTREIGCRHFKKASMRMRAQHMLEPIILLRVATVYHTVLLSIIVMHKVSHPRTTVQRAIKASTLYYCSYTITQQINFIVPKLLSYQVLKNFLSKDCQLVIYRLGTLGAPCPFTAFLSNCGRLGTSLFFPFQDTLHSISHIIRTHG